MAYKIIQRATQPSPTTGGIKIIKRAEQEQPIGTVLERAGHNILPSAFELAKDTVYPFVHPIETAENVYGLGKGALQHAGVVGHEGGDTEEMKMASAVKQHFVNRYGSWEAAKEAFASDPVGVISDLSIPFTGGTSLIAKGLGTTGKLGKVGRVVKAVGTYSDPLKLAAAPIKGSVKRVAAQVTGTSKDTMNIAAGAGRTASVVPGVNRSVEARSFLDHLSGDAPISQPVEMAREGLRQMREEKHAAYLQSIAPTKASRARIDMRPIIQRFHALDRSLQTPGARGQLYKIGPETTTVLKQIRDELSAWYNEPGTHNAIGLDALKQRIQAIKYAATPEGKALPPQADRILTAMTDVIKEEIGKRVPSYPAALKAYEEASAHEHEFQQALSLKDSAGIDTALRKITSAVRNNVNTNFGYRTGLMNELSDRMPGLKEAAAGQTLNTDMPRGLAGGIDPITRTIASTISPRFIGKQAFRAGKYRPLDRGVHQFSRAAGNLDDVERQRRGLRRKAASLLDGVNLPHIFQE